MADDAIIRAATLAELTTLVGWADAEGWNPGVHDAATFWQADPGGYFVAELNGEVVGGISSVRWNDTFGFLGLYIVRPELRGEGIGHHLFARALARVPDGVVAGLDGVLAQIDNYRQSGFELVYRNLRYEGPVDAWRDAVPAGSAVLERAVTIDDVRGIDAIAQPSHRDAYLGAWLAQPDASFALARDGAQVTGYAVARPCGRGWKLGPVIAGDADTAARLVHEVTSDLPGGTTIVLDVPDPHGVAVRLAEARSMAVQFETARMYDAPLAHEPDLTTVFGVTTFELG